MADQPLIAARHLVKTYQLGEQPVHALQDVSFEVHKGEFLAIMGPSGSGKSTLMNMIGALDTPTAGVMAIDGEEVGGMSADQLADLRNRTIGFVFQQFNLLRRTTALDNVKLPLLYSRRRPVDMNQVARASLELVNLGDRLNHQPSQLSGGQQQRVAIARALVNSPRLILADEPTGALDTHTSAEIMALLTRLNAAGLTVIVVTHDPEVAAYAQRLLRMRDGRILSDEKSGATTH
ncbi:MAG TPA: ABC transporter ATP-binding protein [Steroidobacteraceae bacterium]|nr:ABC transporter ATP-binding protein [Steroidobacteraceae bacterium]